MTHKIFTLFFKRIVFAILSVLGGTFQFILIPTLEAHTVGSAMARLQLIHSKLDLLHGSLLEEYPQQLMATMFLPEDAKVIELGGNFGRNSCVIASLLNDSRNLVVLESCLDYAILLEENRNINGLKFHIEASAISKVPLIQLGGKTIPNKVEVPGYPRVNTITFNQLQNKYRLKFDTMVVDCKGALYYLLLDDPLILKNIKMIIIKNDFEDIEHMLYVQKQFRRNGLQCLYNQPGGWAPCNNYFYQVWKK